MMLMMTMMAVVVCPLSMDTPSRGILACSLLVGIAACPLPTLHALYFTTTTTTMNCWGALFPLYYKPALSPLMVQLSEYYSTMLPQRFYSFQISGTATRKAAYMQYALWIVYLCVCKNMRCNTALYYLVFGIPWNKWYISSRVGTQISRALIFVDRATFSESQRWILYPRPITWPRLLCG